MTQLCAMYLSEIIIQPTNLTNAVQRWLTLNESIALHGLFVLRQVSKQFKQTNGSGWKAIFQLSMNLRCGLNSGDIPDTSGVVMRKV